MIPASRNALADWSFSGGPCSQAVSPMLLLKPPNSQITAGCLFPSWGDGLT